MLLLTSRASAAVAAILLAATLSPSGPATAQGFFIPGQQQRPAQATPSQRAPRRQPAPVVPAPPPPSVEAPVDSDAEAGPGPQQQLPPEPAVPALPKGSTPPAAVIGVMGVPDVMRVSSAAQQIEKTIGERREKLNEDAQKEQGAWRDMQQALVNDRGKLSPDQIRSRERALQERITNSQKQFRERGKVIQETAQYSLKQIERTLVTVIRAVAESRGMNLVLHRQQVALNVNEFDITDQVATVLNKVLPSVVIPPDGVAPPTVAENAPSTAPAAAASQASPAKSP